MVSNNLVEWYYTDPLVLRVVGLGLGEVQRQRLEHWLTHAPATTLLSAHTQKNHRRV
jgi:hypothetical protein